MCKQESKPNPEQTPLSMFPRIERRELESRLEDLPPLPAPETVDDPPPVAFWHAEDPQDTL